MESELFEKAVLAMFTQQELNSIARSHNGEFGQICHANYDGSLQLDVFDLYKSDKEDEYLVIEQGNIRLNGTLLECLDYIHGWL